jgi:hypothetical protein
MWICCGRVIPALPGSGNCGVEMAVNATEASNMIDVAAKLFGALLASVMDLYPH